MRYRILGNTYPFKEDLKAVGCRWNPHIKCWESGHIEKDGSIYLKLKSIATACEGDILPVVLSEECEKIQEILNKKP